MYGAPAAVDGGPAAFDGVRAVATNGPIWNGPFFERGSEHFLYKPREMKNCYAGPFLIFRLFSLCM